MEELELKLSIQRDKLENNFDSKWDTFIDQNNEFIDRIMASKHCRKCRKFWESDQVTMEHHPNIIWNTSAGKDQAEKRSKKRQCKYVVFQQWLDFILENVDILREWDEYRDELKGLLNDISQTQSLIPLLDWHYWQFFHERLPKTASDEDSFDSIIIEIHEISENEASEVSTAADDEPENTDEKEKHRRQFLVFFIYFYTEEFGVRDDMEPISFDSDLNLDLYMDSLSLYNLADQLIETYPEAVQNRFGELVIPANFLFHQMTLGDLYAELFQ